MFSLVLPPAFFVLSLILPPFPLHAVRAIAPPMRCTSSLSSTARPRRRRTRTRSRARQLVLTTSCKRNEHLATHGKRGTEKDDRRRSQSEKNEQTKTKTTRAGCFDTRTVVGGCSDGRFRLLLFHPLTLRVFNLARNTQNQPKSILHTLSEHFLFKNHRLCLFLPGLGVRRGANADTFE